jgi:hypothetical protein
MRKLSTDVFDQIKMMKGASAEAGTGNIERERESTRN